MKVEITQNISTIEGSFICGDIVTVSDFVGNDLVRHGFAKMIEEQATINNIPEGLEDATKSKDGRKNSRRSNKPE